MKTGAASGTDHKQVRNAIKARIELAKFKSPTAYGQSKWLKKHRARNLQRLHALGWDEKEFKHCLVLTDNGQRKFIKTANMTRQSAFRRNASLKSSGFQWCAVDGSFTIPKQK